MVKLYHHSSRLAVLSSRSDGSSGVTGQRRASAGASCTNKPNSSIADWGQPCGLPPRVWAGQSCETNPIGRIGWRPEGRNARNEPNLGLAWAGPGPRQAKDAKRTQFPEWSAKTPGAGGANVQTKPVSRRCQRAKQSQFTPEVREGQVLCRERVMMNQTLTGLAQNKANLPPTPGGTGPVGQGTGGGCTNKPNSCHYADPEIGVPGRPPNANHCVWEPP